MSVRPDSFPVAQLCGTEGQLVSVRISIEPRLLERLLDVLARLEFPINPQLYHNAVSDHEPPLTLVEFPAWAGRLGEVREALRNAGFGAAALHFHSMLEEIHSKPRPARASA